MNTVHAIIVLIGLTILGTGCTITGDVVHGDKTAFEKNAKSFAIAGSNNTNAHLDENDGASPGGEGGGAQAPHLAITNTGENVGNAEHLTETLTETTAATGADNRAASKQSDASGQGADKKVTVDIPVKVTP